MMNVILVSLLLVVLTSVVFTSWLGGFGVVRVAGAQCTGDVR